MTPSQRAILLSLAAGSTGFIILLWINTVWYIAGGLGIALAGFSWLTISYIFPSDILNERETTLRRITKVNQEIEELTFKLRNPDLARALQLGCLQVPRLLVAIRRREIKVGLVQSQRSLAYIENVERTLRAYIDVQDSGQDEYLARGREQLKKYQQFASNPDTDLTEQRVDGYIASLTQLEFTPPPELS